MAHGSWLAPGDLQASAADRFHHELAYRGRGFELIDSLGDEGFDGRLGALEFQGSLVDLGRLFLELLDGREVAACGIELFDRHIPDFPFDVVDEVLHEIDSHVCDVFACLRLPAATGGQHEGENEYEKDESSFQHGTEARP